MKFKETNEYWDGILEKFSKHQGTIASFCKKHNVSINKLYYRRKKLLNECSPQQDHVVSNGNLLCSSNISRGKTAGNLDLTGIKPKPTFQAINFNDNSDENDIANNIENNPPPSTEIRIEIGKAKLYINNIDKIALSNVIKEIVSTC